MVDCTDVQYGEECSEEVESGLYFNDVWVYDLTCDDGGESESPPPDGPCVDYTKGW